MEITGLILLHDSNFATRRGWKAVIRSRRLIAEGVETAEQHRDIIGLGCDSCQGYYFARPMPAGELETLMCQPRRTGATVHLPSLASRR